jgi:hypothetical protein
MCTAYERSRRPTVVVTRGDLGDYIPSAYVEHMARRMRGELGVSAARAACCPKDVVSICIEYAEDT